MSGPTEITYKRLASLLAIKKDQHYNTVISLIHCRLCFSLLRSAIMCLRGSRSTASLAAPDFWVGRRETQYSTAGHSVIRRRRLTLT